MLRFDRAKFYEGMRTFERGLSQQQVSGINFILDSMEKDPFLKRVEHAAYMFATVKPETAHTYQPIHEYGGHKYFVRRYGSQTRVGRGLGNDTPEEGAIYAGRGDVQLTGEDNYEKAEVALRRYYPEIVAEFEDRTGKRFDLTVGDQPNDEADADNASDPAIAYAIMSFGMHTGMFTGRSFKTHTTAAGFDAYNARDIINADKKKNGRTIAGYYNHFLAILKASKTSVLAAPVPESVNPAVNPSGNPADSQTPADQILPDVDSTQAPSSTETIIKSEIETQNGSASIEQTNTSFNPDTIPQYIPKMKGVRNWFGTLSLGGIASTTYAAFNDLPPLVIFALGMVTMAVVLGFVFVVVKYRENLFDLVKHVIGINADPTINNIELKSEK